MSEKKTMTTKALISQSLPIPSALGSLDAYISAVNRVPVLSVEQEQAAWPARSVTTTIWMRPVIW